MPTQSQIRIKLAERVLEALKKGKPPWRSDHNRGLPTNPQTGKTFTGINPLVLDAIADREGYRSKYWATYHQWHLLGLQVPKRPSHVAPGDWGVNIVNWQPFVKTVDKGDIISMERFHLLNTITVFNAEQCFGRESGKFLILNEDKITPDYTKVENIVSATKAEIRHHSRVIKPRYDRLPKDRIMLPPRSRFENDAQYWSTVLHELSHYSELRIGWNRPLHHGELMAEIATGLMESELGLPHDTDMTNHDKWVGIWIENIEKDPIYLMDAAAHAARAIDWIMGFTRFQSSSDGI